jgi:hypothetical protein
MWGDEGHKFIEKYIVENLIDKQGNKALLQCLLVVIYLLLYKYNLDNLLSRLD